MTTQKYVKLKNNGGYEGMEHFDYSTVLPVHGIVGDGVFVSTTDLVRGGADAREFEETEDALLVGFWPFFVGDECEFVEVQDGE